MCTAFGYLATSEYFFSSSQQALGNVQLTSREMAVLRKRFEKGAGEGIDLPATLLFFGRDEIQSTLPDSLYTPNTEDSQKSEMETEEKLLQKRRQAQEQDDRSTSDIEVHFALYFLRC